MFQNSWVSPLLTHKPQYFVQAKQSDSRWKWQGVTEHIQYGMNGHKPSSQCWVTLQKKSSSKVPKPSKRAEQKGKNFCLFCTLSITTKYITNNLCLELGVSASCFALWCPHTFTAYSPFICHSCDISYTPFFNIFFFPQCTVTCGQGLRYRVVLCIDHRGMHTGGCSPKTKPHIKEECIVPTPCYKPKGNEAEGFS